jgi:hypothetical protein
MTPEAHAAFTAALLKHLDADPEVLGLVLLGSSSGQPPAPDDFSDHDLFVVTRPGAQERFRNDLGWLPNSAELVLSFRETAHGVRAVDRTGHVVEFAAFDPDELSLARVNRYSVPLDKADVRERMAKVQRETAAGTATPPDERWLVGQFLTELVVGAGRYARGERISGHFRVRLNAVQHLLGLLRLRATPAGARCSTTWTSRGAWRPCCPSSAAPSTRRCCSPCPGVHARCLPWPSERFPT